MGGDQQEVKGHWCKVCRRSFPCGRSLGGHMRSHLSLSSPAPEADERSARGSKSCVAGSRTGYGLRENPKKSWRLSETAGRAKEHGESCKQCDRVFPTLKSLFGHMRCHSQKLHCKLEDENGAEMESEQGMEMKVEPGTDLVMPRRKRKRSRRLASISGSSSSASEIDKEQENAALTLMMLSRETNFRSCVNSVEAPNLNSVFSEAKGTLKSWKGISECRIQHYRNGPKSSDSDVSFDELALGDEFMKLEAHADDAEDVDHSLETTKKSSITKCLNLSTDDMLPEAYGTKLSPEQVSIVSDGYLHKAPKKKSRYECPLCNETFNSYQSFGGHRASHIRRKGCVGAKNKDKKIKSRTNAYEKPKIIGKIVNKNVCIGTSSGSIKKVSEHECSICCNVFSSTQALGGHKRSHLLASSGNDAYKYQQTTVVEQKTATTDVLDHNLPAPTEKGSDLNCDNFRFGPW